MDEETIDRILARFRDRLLKESASGKKIVTIDEIEAAALRLRESAGELISEELSSHSLTTEEEHACENKTECRCGRVARFKGVRTHTCVSMASVVRFRRRYFYCRRCNAGFCPVDERLGITRSAYTNRVQQEASRLCTMAPYSVAVGLFHDLCGVRVSVSHAQWMVERADVFASAVLSDRLEASEEADRSRLNAWPDDIAAARRKARMPNLYVEMDGVQTPMVRSWNEMKVGVCFSVSKKGSRSDKRYVSHLGSARDFAPHLYALAVEMGLDAAERIVVLGDGAPWIWNLAEEQFPGALQILDVWHALDRLGNVARCAFAQEDTSGIKQWLDQRKEELLASRLADVRKAVSRLSQVNPACNKAVRSEMGYLKNNASRMDYAQYISQGLHIGSGVAESACKRVVTQRLKGAGMRWANAGAAAMARLRCLSLSNEWHKLINQWKKQALFNYATAT
jgi:hypothetical protein